MLIPYHAIAAAIDLNLYTMKDDPFRLCRPVHGIKSNREQSDPRKTTRSINAYSAMMQNLIGYTQNIFNYYRSNISHHCLLPEKPLNSCLYQTPGCLILEVELVNSA
jgi:hypothetical protein